MLPKSHGDSSYWISGGAVLQIDFNELKKEDCRTVARRLGLEINRQDKARCFLHVGDKNPSLQVYADGWKCFGCGEGTPLTSWPGIGAYQILRRRSG